MTETPDFAAEPAATAPAIDPIDALLAHGTARTETVNLYTDQALMDEIERFYNRRDKTIEAALAADEEHNAMLAMGERHRDTVTALEEKFDAEEEELTARYEASQIVVTVRALEQTEIDEIRDKFPMPPAPERLAFSAPARLKALWEKERDEFVRKAEKVERQQDAHMVAAAVIEFRHGATVRTSITPEEVLRIRAAAYGGQRIERILAAIKKASTERTEVSRPK